MFSQCLANTSIIVFLKADYCCTQILFIFCKQKQKKTNRDWDSKFGNFASTRISFDQRNWACLLKLYELPPSPKERKFFRSKQPKEAYRTHISSVGFDIYTFWKFVITVIEPLSFERILSWCSRQRNFRFLCSSNRSILEIKSENV